jgi:hypothetical protein
MSLIISESIRKREFKKGQISSEDLRVLLRSARVDLGVVIQGSQLPAGTHLIKAYATSSGGPRRIVYLLSVEDGDLFLLFYRDKKDPVGENISLKNPVFKRELHKHLDLLLADIKSERYEIHDL